VPHCTAEVGRMKKKHARPPTVYVIAGPNGAGKTTFASQFLPDFVKCREFLNADLIAAGLSPFAAETQNLQAGRLLLERVRELAGEHESDCIGGSNNKRGKIMKKPTN
jgi:predicted kinase